MECDCEEYSHLELYREAIDKRIRKTRKIKKQLDLVAENSKFHSILWKCPVCNQLWQSSEAWNWGSKEYIYKVPDISLEDWFVESFIKPDELLIFSAMLQHFEENNSFIERDIKCKDENCLKNAIKYSVLCKGHHMQSLQKSKVLPDFPDGRIFEPYKFQ